MADMSRTGVITRVFPVKGYGKKDFRKSEFHIEVANGNYTDNYAFEMVNQMADDYDGELNVGDEVEVDAWVRGREYDKGDGSDVRIFTSLVVHNVVVTEPAASPPSRETQVANAADGDVPF